MAGDRIAPRRLLAYAAPSLALAMPTIPAYMLLPTFYADTLGLGLAATGAALFVARLTDVVTDPVIGIASDRIATRWGRRKPWIAIGAPIAAIALIQLFTPPAAPDAFHLALWAIVLYLGWTLVAVPYAAWGAEMSGDYHDRARITAVREGFMIAGVVIAPATSAIVLASGGETADGLATIAWLAIAIGAPTLFVLLRRVPEPAPPAATTATTRAAGGGRAAIALVAGNGPFRRLLAAWFVNGLANGIPAALFPLYVEYALGGGTTLSGVLILLYFAAGIAAIPLWTRMSARRGKHVTWCRAMALAIAAFVWVPFLGPDSVWLFAIVCVLTGMALGADLALPPAMQADVVDYDTLRSGQPRAGLFFALWSMATKLALAAAVGIAFPALALIGFELGRDNTPGAILALALIYAVVPCILKAGAIALVWRHPITERRQRAIRRRIEARARRAG
ncbi:MAG: MFS transporter [Alphaproteobacteria bacterium]|nr:MFS transporter [Alphaproteobacteria bacterium]